MFNYQINVEYLGTNYVGWQIQKNGISVQSIVQKALSKVLRSKINIVGSGRTDSGVHAKAQSANFFSKKEIKDKYKFLNSVNFFLKNKSVSIIKINRKNINFHSRYSVVFLYDMYHPISLKYSFYNFLFNPCCRTL